MGRRNRSSSAKTGVTSLDINSLPITGLVLHFRTPEKTIACLCAQQKAGLQRVIIVDNSEDNGASIAAMQPELELLRNNGLAVEVQNSKHNLGFAAGVNLGLKKISDGAASHVLLINSDAQLLPDTIEHMRIDLNNAPIVAPLIAQSNQPPSSPFYYYDRLFGLITNKPKLAPQRYASGCCLLIHNSLCQTPLFDQDFFFYGEDVMLGYTSEHQNITQKECSQAIVLHATSSSAKNGSLFYEYHMNRAHWLLAKKLARNPLEQFLFVAARCVTLPLRAVIRSTRFRSFLAWKGLALATTDVICGRCRSFTPPAS